jgi:hypothetical protein
MGMSLAGYGLLGTGHEQAAARVQRWSGAAGLVVALAGGLVLAWSGAGGAGMVAFAVAQLGFQAASAILVCYRRELLLLTAMAPACGLGVAHLLTGYADALTVPTLVAGGLSGVLALALAWRTSVRAPTRPDPPRRPPALRLALAVVPGVAYSAVSAFFLLYSDSRYVLAPIDLAIAVTPLVLGMGALEWRSHGFDARSRELVRRAENTDEFRREARRALLRELTVCLLVLAGFAVALMLVLGAAGVLTSRGALLVDAHVVLGGAYFLGFVLGNHGGLPRLLMIVTVVTVAHVAAMALFSGYFAPYGEVPVFLASSVALLLALLTALWFGVGRVYDHR